jgi:hypothetical protein
MTRNILMFSVIAEIATGAALMIAPAIVVTLLLAAETSDVTSLVGRCFGGSLVALGVACWQHRSEALVGRAAIRAMLVYNALIAMFLGYGGAVVEVTGPLLWPVVALHAVVAVLLLWRMRANQGSTTG